MSSVDGIGSLSSVGGGRSLVDFRGSSGNGWTLLELNLLCLMPFVRICPQVSEKTYEGKKEKGESQCFQKILEPLKFFFEIAFTLFVFSEA